jgi:hypothetical protein
MSGELLALVLRLANPTYCWRESVVELPDDLHVSWVVLEGRDDHPLHPEQARHVRDWCEAHAVPFCFLGWGGCVPADQVDIDWYGDVLLRDRPARFSESIYVEGLLCYTTCWWVGRRCSGRYLDGHRHEAVPACLD